MNFHMWSSKEFFKKFKNPLKKGWHPIPSFKSFRKGIVNFWFFPIPFLKDLKEGIVPSLSLEISKGKGWLRLFH